MNRRLFVGGYFTGHVVDFSPMKCKKPVQRMINEVYNFSNLPINPDALLSLIPSIPATQWPTFGLKKIIGARKY